MTGRTVSKILDHIRLTWSLANDAEITLEANPGSVEVSRFAEYKTSGVNRISIGVQALNDLDLRRLGRMHSVDDALRAISIAREHFAHVSMDLIYSRQDQSLAQWEDELKRTLALSPNHLSLYQLTIEEGTVFGERFHRGLLGGLPSEDLSADMYEYTQEICATAGLHAYEVSNHAKPGHESQHNRIYWTGGDYLGIGPGAHGRMTIDNTRWATEAEAIPRDWLRLLHSNTAETRHKITPEERGIEYVLMGLRLTEGISLARFQHLSGSKLNRSKINQLKELGLLQEDQETLKTTSKGRLLLNQVIATLVN